MHTTRVKDDEGSTWIIIHNGDWSGTAHVRAEDWDDSESIALPGFVLKNACKQALVQEVQGLIETALDNFVSESR